MGKQTSTFKGFDDWIEVFAGGPQTDSAGRTREWTEADLDSIVANFSPDDPAPAVIGHPRNDAPAYGWVAALKRQGKKLLAKFADVAPEFEQMVREGRFRKRSVAIDKAGDGFRLRHVGWLGAAAPAVKGLKPVSFSDEEPDFEFSFDDEIQVGLWRRLREWLIERFDLETADQVVPAGELNLLTDLAMRPEPEPASSNSNAFTRPASNGSGSGVASPEFSGEWGSGPSNQGGTHTMSEGTKTFTQADIEAARQQALQEAADQRAALQAKLDEERRARLSAQFQAQIEKAIEAGRLTPAQAEGMLEFMLALPGDPERPFEFTAGEGEQAATVKMTPMEWFNRFVERLPEQVQVGGDSGAAGDIGPLGAEFAAPPGYSVDAEQAELHRKALAYQAQHPDTDYITAVKAVQGGE